MTIIVLDARGVALNPYDVTIPPAQSMLDTLRFTPTTGGVVSGVVVVISNAPTSPDTVNVSGIGLTKTITIPTDTSTITFDTMDSTHVAIAFQSGAVSGHTVTFETFGLTPPPVVQGIRPSNHPVLYFVIDTTIPSAVAFAATITLTYTDNQLAAAGVINEDSLTVAFFNPSSSLWRFVSAMVDKTTNTITFERNHFSIWVLAEKESPNSIDEMQDGLDIPRHFALQQNRPNPFNPSTQIVYEVSQRAHITMTIHNLLGQEVIHLVDGKKAPGRYVVFWNGQNDQGINVASGVYLCRLSASTGFSQTIRMILLK